MSEDIKSEKARRSKFLSRKKRKRSGYSSIIQTFKKETEEVKKWSKAMDPIAWDILASIDRIILGLPLGGGGKIRIVFELLEGEKITKTKEEVLVNIERDE